jgi:hypothetical protein
MMLFTLVQLVVKEPSQELLTMMPSAISYVESNYDLFLDDADIGMADFDGDLDTDIVLTGKWNGDQYVVITTMVMFT